MINSNLRIAILPILALVPLIGCGQGDQAQFTPDPAGATDSIRGILQEVARTGEKGSAYTALPGEIERLREVDADKAETLQEDYERLEEAKTSTEVKKQAKTSLERL